MDYKFIADLFAEASLPDKGILSNVLHKDENLNVTLFGFAAGQELSAHSAPTPAILYFLEGEAAVQLGMMLCKRQLGHSYSCRQCCHTASARSRQSRCCWCS